MGLGLVVEDVRDDGRGGLEGWWKDGGGGGSASASVGVIRVAEGGIGSVDGGSVG